MTRVRDVMTTTVQTVRPDAPFPELVDTLLRHGISGLPVVDDDGELVGIVTEADLVSKEAYGGRRRRALQLLADVVAGGEVAWAPKGRGRTARQVMTEAVVTTTPTEDVRVAARRMLDRHVKRLPVLDAGRVVGMVSRTDLLRMLHRGDNDLMADLEAMLADPLRAPDDLDVSATVSEGVVMLEGSVRFPADLPVLTAMVWRIPGVVDVRNDAVARESLSRS